MDKAPLPTPLPIGKVQMLNGSFVGRQVDLNKTLTTLGQPGVPGELGPSLTAV